MKSQGHKNTIVLSLSADQWRKQAISRSNCYGMLALVLRDVPTMETIYKLRESPLVQTLKYLGYNVAQELAGELEQVAQELGEQYTRTFVGPGPHLSLFASIYCDGEGQLWGSSTVWVKHFIETIGLRFRGNWDSIPDHIAIELELMQRLAVYEADLWGRFASAQTKAINNKKRVGKQLYKCLDAQQKFLQEHLCKWIPKFCRRVVEVQSSSFYQEMARLTKSVILSDIEHVTVAQSVLKDEVPKV